MWRQYKVDILFDVRQYFNYFNLQERTTKKYANKQQQEVKTNLSNKMQIYVITKSQILTYTLESELAFRSKQKTRRNKLNAKMCAQLFDFNKYISLVGNK